MKRVIFAIVNGAMGALIGLLVALLSGWNSAIIVCAILGALASLAVRPAIDHIQARQFGLFEKCYIDRERNQK